MRKQFLILTLLAAGAAAQSEDDALARARIVEEVEHDYARAAKMYAAIAASAGEKAVAARAWLRLADVRAKLGEFEAAQAALERAAAGEGPAAQEAQRRVLGQDGEAQALELIAKLRRGEDVAGELVWLGRVAAEPLVRWVDRDRVDLEFVSAAARVLVRIGGPRVIAWLGRVQSDYGLLERRAVLRGTKDLPTDPELVSALQGFTVDPEPAVVMDALDTMPTLFRPSQLIGLLGHPDSGIRQRAAEALRYWERLPGDKSTAVRRQLLEALLARREQLQAKQLGNLSSIFDRFESAADRGLWLAALSLGVGLGMPARLQIEPDQHAGSVLETARALGPVAATPTPPQVSLAQFVARCLDHWSHASLDVVLELVDLGYGAVPNMAFGDWFRRVAARDDWPAVFSRAHRFADERMFKNLEFEPNPAAFEPLREYALRLLADPAAGASRIHDVLAAILRVESDEAVGWVADHISGALWESSRLDQRRALHDELLVKLVVARRRESVEVLVRHYQAGRVSTSRRDEPILLRVAGLRQDPELVAAILDACLDTGNPQVWLDLDARPHDASYNSLDWEHLPWPVARVAVEHAAAAPEEVRRSIYREVFQHPDIGQARDRVVEALGDGDPLVRRFALFACRRILEAPDALAVVAPLLDDPDAQVVADAIETLRAPGAAELVAPLLQHASGLVRLRALEALAGVLDPERAVEWALQVRFEDSVQVRLELCEIASRTLDRRLVPVLIELLRDPGKVRESAQKTLDAIRSYHDEKARWQRILDGTDLGASSAAEALVLQARDGDDREVRLAAVRSLGTLGVPETLPFLITLMRDPDAEVAVAARAAIEKINAR